MRRMRNTSRVGPLSREASSSQPCFLDLQMRLQLARMRSCLISTAVASCVDRGRASYRMRWGWRLTAVAPRVDRGSYEVLPRIKNANALYLVSDPYCTSYHTRLLSAVKHIPIPFVSQHSPLLPAVEHIPPSLQHILPISSCRTHLLLPGVERIRVQHMPVKMKYVLHCTALNFDTNHTS